MCVWGGGEGGGADAVGWGEVKGGLTSKGRSIDTEQRLHGWVGWYHLHCTRSDD
jgi:hypothetical protein